MNEDPFDNPLDNQFDPLEIDKIQAEIERDLNSKNQTTLVSAEPIADPEPTDVGFREVVEESVITELPMEDIDAPKADNSFFRESVKSSPTMTFKRIALLVCVGAVLCGLSIGTVVFVAGNMFAGTTATTVFPVATFHDFDAPNFSFVQDMDIEGVPPQVEAIYGVMSFADLIDNVRPSVVCITAYKETFSASDFFTIPDIPSGIPGIQPPDRPGRQGRLSPHSGSGIIFDKDDERLFIVTNNHVVAGAEYVTVSINGTDEVEGFFLGRDFDSDLAVLTVRISDFQAIGINDFTVAAFANSDSMRIGDFVIAIGNALGRGNVATFGFVSAVDAEVYAYGRVFTVIQTDAAINPGNSGGALLNLRGEVIGINMLKFVDASVEGTGYALTSNVAMPIIERIRNQTPRPLLGIQGTNMTETISRAFNLPMMGIIVESVFEGSGAERAGIRSSDIITSFNGTPVINMEELSRKVQSHNIGDTVQITLIRDGRDVIDLNVTLLENISTNF